MSRQSYAQHIFKLGLPVGDPLVELASTWASGQQASARDVKLAVLSAERWRSSKDKRMRVAANSLLNKLMLYLERALKVADKKGEFSILTLPSRGRGRSYELPYDATHYPAPSIFAGALKKGRKSRYAPGSAEEKALVKFMIMDSKRKAAYRRAASRRAQAETGEDIRPDFDHARYKIAIGRNPRVKFRTCRGKRVAFKSKGRRKGATPRHLKKYLFKKGHRPHNRCK